MQEVRTTNNDAGLAAGAEGVGAHHASGAGLAAAAEEQTVRVPQRPHSHTGGTAGARRLTSQGERSSWRPTFCSHGWLHGWSDQFEWGPLFRITTSAAPALAVLQLGVLHVFAGPRPLFHAA